MLPAILVGKGVAALSVFKRHWGKIISGLFVIAWIWATIGLHNNNKELSTKLGAASAAVDVCIADRVNMDNALIRLKSEIEAIQADNDRYKQRLELADSSISALESEINESIVLIDQEVLPESCEGSMDWMLKKALEQ